MNRNPFCASIKQPQRGLQLSFRRKRFLHTLLGTKDSAPGPDGIPYSAWRLSPEGSYPVLEHLMGKMISGARAAPVQVGVWIPKAKLGPTADYFRPLECPIPATG